jgi:aminoglycoside phosphotransferase (APT) family kinase protein
MTLPPKPTIPYYAPADELPAPLPTIDEILTLWYGKDTPLVSCWRTTPVLRIREHFAVKLGSRTSVQEGLNQLFVTQVTNIPVPKVYAIMEKEIDGDAVCFIVMEYIAGKILGDIWNDIGPDKKQEITTNLCVYMKELRSVPSPGYFGSAWEGRYMARELLDFHMLTPHPEPEIRGPHKTIDEFAEGMFLAWKKMLRRWEDFTGRKGEDWTGREAEERRGQLWRRLYHATFKRDSTPVFSHGDWERCNILMADDGRVVVIDWENAGWYPKFWDPCKAYSHQNHDDWDDHLLQIFGFEHDIEYTLWHTHLDCLQESLSKSPTAPIALGEGQQEKVKSVGGMGGN